MARTMQWHAAFLVDNTKGLMLPISRVWLRSKWESMVDWGSRYIRLPQGSSSKKISSLNKLDILSNCPNNYLVKRNKTIGNNDLAHRRSTPILILPSTPSSSCPVCVTCPIAYEMNLLWPKPPWCLQIFLASPHFAHIIIIYFIHNVHLPPTIDDFVRKKQERKLASL